MVKSGRHRKRSKMIYNASTSPKRKALVALSESLGDISSLRRMETGYDAMVELAKLTLLAELLSRLIIK